MKKLFTFFPALVTSAGTTFAWDYEHVQIGDLYYNLDAELQTAEVTFYENDLSDGHFNTGWTIVSVDIPSAVTHNGTFYNVTRIGANAFAHCFELTSITIPNSITSIGNTAFFASHKLSSVTMESTTPPIAELEYQDGETYNIFHYSGCDHGRGNIYVPCGSLEAYQIAEGWSEYSSIIKYILASYPITRDGEKGKISIPRNLTICDESVEVTATPIRGCYFVSWSDGNTDNPRIINVDQYESLNAIFDYLLEGNCGKDSVLVWKLDTTTMALEITGKGALSENYTYGTFIESLTIGNEVSTIGQNAFYECNNLKNVILGSSVKVLEEGAFYYCSAIETITCYGQRPPTVNQYALYGLDYSTIVYVPADYLETYKMHDAWGLYDVRPLGAKSTETTNLNVTPAETTAEVAWPAVSGAATYELVINDKSGNVICTLIFNSNGQLTQIAFNAPARNNAPRQTQSNGFSFIVTGLESGTGYDLTITTKDSNGTTLQENTMSFTTTGGEQAIDNINSPSLQLGAKKVVIDGRIFILSGNQTYTLTGAEFK